MKLTTGERCFKLVLILLLLFRLPEAKAQLSAQYSFTAYQSSYADLVGAAVLPDFSYDDTSAIVPLGFNFSFNGVSYNQVRANSNGWLSFNATAPQTWQSYNNLNVTTLNAVGPCLMPLWMNLDGTSGTAAYQTTGLSPNRVFCFEWKNWEWDNDADAPVISFQARLYETSNKIEFTYRQEATPIHGLLNDGAAIGLGVNNSNLLGLTNTSSLPGLFYSSASAAMPEVFAKPASGQVYSFELLPACTGTPQGGIIVSPAANTCPNVPIKIELANYSAASGLSFQWQTRPAGNGSFASISGATGTTYVVTGQVAATDFRCVVTCLNSSQVVSSDTFTLGMYPANLCYCITALGGGASGNYSIDTVVILNTTLNNPSFGFAPGNYTLYPPSGNTTLVMEQGSSYTMKISKGSTITSVGAWIDYDQDGVYEPTEFTAFPAGGLNTIASLTIPTAALTGNTGMRVRSRGAGGTIGAANGCTFLPSGETEDYIVMIIPAVACSGSPSPGIATASLASVCPDISFNLLVSGYTATGSVTLQWQSAPAGTGLFTDLSGANTPLFSILNQVAATDYRCKSTCTANNIISYSDTVTVASTPVADCYCAPVYTQGCVLGNHDIDDFVLNGSGDYAINDFATGCSPGAYDIRLPFFPALELIQGQTYYGAINSNGYGNIFRFWVDFANNGIFDQSDTVSSVLQMAAYDLPYSIYIPLTADTGFHRMRVRSVSTQPPVSPCSSAIYGEAHDYPVRILKALPDDLGVSMIVSTAPGTEYCAGDTIPVRVVVTNYGNQPKSGFQVFAAYLGSSSGSLQLNYPGTLSPHGHDTLFMGQVVITTAGNYAIKAYTALAADTRAMNDTSYGSLIVHEVPQVDLGADTSLCQSLFPFLVDAGNPGCVYLWSDLSALSALSIYTPGTYWVKVKNFFGCISRDTIEVLTQPEPSVAGIIVTGSGNTFSFSAGFPQYVSTYSWSFGDGSTASSPGTGHVYSSTGSFPVKLIVANDCGSDSASFEVLVLATGIKTPSGSSNGILVYPNPAKDVLHVSLPGGNPPSRISVTDANGSLVYQNVELLNTETLDVDIHDLPAGHYFLVLVSGGEVFHEMFGIVR